ncbi:MAG: hypothetical protein HY074_07760 [Deltaproteobacteria bacterium]|nr:hypothetical protein [Deltaproteobacteria bacterium]
MKFKRILRCVGRYGEYYLARTRQEYFRILSAGGGGGMIVASTVVFKYLIIYLRLPLLAEASLFGLNYAGSFLLMQGLGFRLATKQPSLLAVTLLRRRRNRCTRTHLARILRSQLAATAGNFGFVVLGALGFHVAFTRCTGKIFLSDDAAVHAMASLNPFHASTIGYAALTGGLLWLASLAAGWASHCARKGRPGAAVIKHWAGFGYNVSLAFLLCAVPYAGKLLSLPLDVRHFTLSSGALALSVYTLGFKAACQAGLGSALLGIIVIGFMNFFVSFLISLVVALGVYRISWRRLFLFSESVIRTRRLQTQ